MLFQLMSDLHLDLNGFEVKAPTDETVLLLGGDISTVTTLAHQDRIIKFLGEVNKLFHKVIYIAGNHEHYHGSILLTPHIIKSLIKSNNFDNVIYLENETYQIDNVAIIGSTFWSSLTVSLNPKLIPLMINDYRHIFTTDSPPVLKKEDDLLSNKIFADHSQRLITCDDTKKIHLESLDFIFNEIERCNQQGLKTIVMTHHAPSKKSISPGFESSPLNGAFVSEYDRLIEEKGPDYWVHGHVHSFLDYYIGRSRVLCNPRGYRNEVTGFIDQLTFTL